MSDERNGGADRGGGVGVVLVGPGPAVRGGIAQFVANLAAVLSLDHEVRQVGFRRVYPRWMRAGRHAGSPSSAGGPEPLLVPWLPWTWLRAGQILGESSPDLLVIQWWNPLLAPCFHFLAKRARSLGIAVAFVCHNAVPHEWFPLSRALTRWTLSLSDRVLTLSGSVAEQVRELIPDADVVVKGHPPNLVSHDTEKGTWREKVGPAPVVLFFGNVRAYKGLADLIAAMPRVHEETGARLVVAGQFLQPESRYHREAERCGVSDHVRFFPGYVPDEQVGELFGVADVIALPYRSASQSGILPEAAEFGRPVVATAVGGIPEVLDGHGVVVPPGDPQALAEGLVSALREPPDPPLPITGGWRSWSGALAEVTPAAEKVVARTPRRVAAALLWVVVFAFVAKVFFDGLSGLSGTSISMDWKPFALAILLTMLASITNVLGWHALLRGTGTRLPLRTSARVFSSAELVRFLPGGVLHLAARYRFAQRVGVSPEVVVTTTAMDLGLRVIVALIVFVVSIAVWPNAPHATMWLVIVALPFLIVMFHPKVLSYFVERAGRTLRGRSVRAEVGYGATGLAILWSAIGWALRGAALFLVATSVTDLSARYLLPTMGVSGLSWVAGVVTPIAPGGLGVREAVGASLMKPWMTLSLGIVVMLLARLVSIVVEVATAALATAWDVTVARSKGEDRAHLVAASGGGD
jgi:glycosyltransferase involved in cell wall biosynthesis